MNRRFRLLVALGIAIVMSTFLMYTALAGGDVREHVIEAQELDTGDNRRIAGRETVEFVGVAAGPVVGKEGKHITFFLSDRTGAHKTRVSYDGAVPDAFRVGRNVIVKGKLTHGTFVAEPGSLVTKCPSKFESAGGSSRSSS
jgi:cytochrome c-type biogenesis protein CcmE